MKFEKILYSKKFLDKIAQGHSTTWAGPFYRMEPLLVRYM
jgi:hypothetical protein